MDVALVVVELVKIEGKRETFFVFLKAQNTDLPNTSPTKLIT